MFFKKAKPGKPDTLTLMGKNLVSVGLSKEAIELSTGLTLIPATCRIEWNEDVAPWRHLFLQGKLAGAPETHGDRQLDVVAVVRVVFYTDSPNTVTAVDVRELTVGGKQLYSTELSYENRKLVICPGTERRFEINRSSVRDALERLI